jgi:hypothetical protein
MTKAITTNQVVPSQAQKLAAELELLVRARFSVIQLISTEEHRAINILSQVARNRGQRLWIWSRTDGMISPAQKDPALVRLDGEKKDPAQALDWVLKCEDRSLIVLKNLHPYFKKQACFSSQGYCFKS